MRERVIRTFAQSVAAALVVFATAIGAALGQGRSPSRTELGIALWAALQVLLTTLASGIHYKLFPPDEGPAGPWDPRRYMQ